MSLPLRARRLPVVLLAVLACLTLSAVTAVSARAAGRSQTAAMAKKHRHAKHKACPKKGKRAHRPPCGCPKGKALKKVKGHKRCVRRHKAKHPASGTPGAGAPAAERIVYGCGVNICAAATDGSGQHQLTTDGGQGATQYIEPSVSLDGSRMVFQGTDAQGFTADGSGRNVRRITDGALPVTEPQISPDGASVLWTESSGAGTYTYLTDFAASSPPDEFPAPRTIAGFGPNGTVFCDVDPARLYVQAVAAIHGPDCGTEVAEDATGGTFGWRPRVSPDGSLLVDSLSHDGGISTDGIYLYDVATHALVRQLSSQADDDWPTFSPDGRWVLFERSGAGAGIYKVPTAGGTPTLLIADGEHPNWVRG